MREQLIAALGVEFDLTAEEIADILWLALQQSSEFFSSSQPSSEKQPVALTPTVNLSRPDDSKRSNSSTRSSSAEPLVEEPPTDLIAEDNPKAQIYPTTQSNRQRSTTTGTLSLALPDAPSLREPLSLTRALRPLMSRVPSPKATQINETATAERTAAEGLCIPVLQPLKEPWLEIALVVDEGISMVIWRHTVIELKRLLEHYGAFRYVRTWALVNDEQQKTIFLRAGIGVTTNNPRLHSPKELIDPAKRRLVLVVSDCVSAMWRNGDILPALQVWAENGPMAVVQMLPQWLWNRTALGLATSARFSGLTPGVANTALQMQVSSLWDDEDFEQGIKVPVLTLEPEMAATWSKMVSGQGNIWAPGFVFAPAPDLEEETAPQENSTSLSAEERVQGFRLNASPLARRLAGLLSAAPTICLPVVRIIQDAMLPASRQVHVAEVFLGGLLKPVSEIKPNTNPDAVLYDFIEGVRELLLNSTPQSDSLTVLNAVSEYVAERMGKNLYEFNALLKNPQQSNNQDEQEQIQHFAEITSKVLKRLGGEYARFAEEIENFEHQNEKSQQRKIETPTVKKHREIIDSNVNPKTILILAANPTNTNRLRLEEEIREIDEGLRRANQRHQFKLEQKWAVRSHDVYRGILDYQPQIVHFCGHGDGIVLEDDTGKMVFLETKTLASMFKLFAKKSVECVIFNACYSEVQAEAISQYVDYVLGTKKAVGDKNSITFCVTFYNALAAGYEVEEAYELGCSQMISFLEQETPVFKKKPLIPTAVNTDIPILDDVIPPNPYQGFAAFGEEDADFFFGQENFINKLVEVTQNQPLVGIIGPSSSGKSSVVFAGLIPKLRQQGNWLIEVFRPGKEPFLPLASALVRQLEPEAGETQFLRESVGLASDFQQGRITVQQVISRILERNPGKRLLLVADQLEELFTLCPVKEEQEHFADELLAVIAQENIRLVFTLRADFYGYVLSYRPFRDALQEYTPQLLSSMKRKELQAAIELPAQKLEVQLEEQLTQRILDDVEQEPGNLPLLEFTLTQLWEKQKNRTLTHAAYQEIGGVKKAITNYAEQVYQRLSEPEKQQAQRIFVQLVRPGEGTEDTRRVATKTELNDRNWNLVKQLADARLVVTGRQEQEDTVEVVHEALIREWQRLREWMNANRQFRTWQERLKVALQEWKNYNYETEGLLRGTALSVAENWLHQRGDEMTQEERDFIQESIKRNKKASSSFWNKFRNFGR